MKRRWGQRIENVVAEDQKFVEKKQSRIRRSVANIREESVNRCRNSSRTEAEGKKRFKKKSFLGGVLSRREN
jgi:hypothetical protein